LYLTFSVSMGRVDDANRHLTQLNSLYMSTIETLAMAIDAKDQITHGHIRRVQTYAVALAKEVGVADESLIRAIEAAALLHDMGKLAVPEYILNKPGPLTPAEFDKMKLHASVGADILSSINFPYPVVPIVRHHHENWDGTGYPDGLLGTNIPIGARILSVVDCFDALTSDRPYRPRLAQQDALRILSERRGSMYDPLVVDTFARVHMSIAPPNAATSKALPLRAITDASHTTPSGAPAVTRLDEITASTGEMVTLFDLTRDLTPAMSLSDVGDIISKHLRRLIPCSLCVVFVYDVASDDLIAAHCAGDNSPLFRGLRIALGQRLSGWVAANRQSIRNSDAVLDLGDAARSISPRPRSCLSTPLVAGHHLVGVLTLYSTAVNAFTDEHQRLIEQVAIEVAVIVNRSSEFTVPGLSSLRDELAKLPTVDSLRQLMDTTARDCTSVLAIRLREFAALARHTGYNVDDALACVVAAARSVQRSTDLLLRSGAEHFVIVMLHTDESEARSLSSLVRDAMMRRRGTAKVLIDINVVTNSGPDDCTLADLIDRAANWTANTPPIQKPHSTLPPRSVH
ncbi:MAG: HD domain-containing protein, partial [Acidobacteriota bacterium]|nr:HD domain-containing protein [Acidobacteriota bacterium]